MTTSRRVDPIPQLKCVGGDAQGLHEVDVMRCTNMDYSENPNDEEYEYVNQKQNITKGIPGDMGYICLY